MRFYVLPPSFLFAVDFFCTFFILHWHHPLPGLVAQISQRKKATHTHVSRLSHLFLVQDLKPIRFCSRVLDRASTGPFPTFAEECGMAQTHVFERLRQKTQRDLDDASFFHGFLRIPFIREQGIHDFIAFGFKHRDSSFACFPDFLFRFSSHRL